MTITNVDKVGDHIRIVEDGLIRFLTVVGEDIPVSVPISGKRQVINLYVDEATSKLYVAYHQDGWEEGSPSVLEIVAGAAAGDMLKSTYDTDDDGVVDNSEQLGGDTLAEVETTMDEKITAHVAVADPHTAYVLKSLFDTGTLLYAAASGNPEAKTRAELLALLSGQAGASFDFNTKDLDNVRHIGLGVAANDLYVLSIVKTFIIDDNNPRRGVSSYTQAYKTSAQYTNLFTSGYFNARILTNNTQNWIQGVGLRAVEAKIDLASGTASPSTITGAAGFYVWAYIGPAANDMVLTNLYGLYVVAMPLVSNSKLTNCYGIYIGSQEGGATLNYAIYTNIGLVRFGDNVVMASEKTVDGRDLSVDGAKLDNIAANATKYPDTGEQAFLDADHTKLDGIAAGATVYPDTGEQAFLDADHSKLDGIDAGADVTGSNAPQAHKASHENTGGDEISVTGLSGLLADDQHVLDAEVQAIKLDDFTAPDDNTDLNATTSAHGLLKKLDNTATNYMDGTGNWSEPAGGGAHKDTHDPEDGADALDAAAPAELAGVQAAGEGSAHELARADHAHQIQAAITDDHLLTVDDAAAADNDFARFTANGIEGLTVAEAITALLGAALPENVNLEWNNALSADGKWSGMVTKQFNGGATIPFGEIMYLKAADSEWYQAKADVTATSGAVMVAICVLATTDGNPCTALLMGKVRADAKFPTFTISAPVFISAATAGLLTSIAPTGTTNFVVRIVGHAGTGDEIYFNPNNSYVELA